jgi:hypothetical protein
MPPRHLRHERTLCRHAICGMTVRAAVGPAVGTDKQSAQVPGIYTKA